MPDSPEIYKWSEEDVPDIGQTFQIIHESDIIHRDLHSNNIISTSIGHIIDFTKFPMNLPSSYTIILGEEISSSDISPDDPSTQIVKLSPEMILDVKNIEEYKTKFTNSLLQLIHEEVFEFGMENAADRYVQENLRDYPLYTKVCLNEMLLKHFADVGVATGLLRIISHIDYEEIHPIGQTMALSVLNHENIEIRECGIRAFENWGNIDSLDILKHIKCEEKWLQDYLDKVIIYLEECHVAFSQKT
jgi:serine/threonine protein kinase